MAERRELTADQRRAATPGRSTAVIAAAGSGKTAVLVERYLATLRTGLTPSEVLVVTFTRAAAAEVRHRAVATLAAAAKENGDASALALAESVRRSPFLGTLHGLAFELLRRSGLSADLPAVERVASESEVAERLRTAADRAVVQRSSEDAAILSDAFTPTDWRALVRLAIEHRMALEPLLRTTEGVPGVRSAIARSLLTVYGEWDQALNQSGVYSYGDLERVAVLLAESPSDAGAALRKQFRAALVDEFQDTNAAQWRLVQALLRWDSPERGELFIVGDPRQSIYRFRGARPELFTSVAAQVSSSDGHLVALATNFRSRPKLVSATNLLLEPLFGAGTLEATATEAGRDDDGDAAIIRLTYESGEKRGEQRSAEADTVALYLERLVTTVAPESIAILLRSSEPITLFAEALRKRGIPVAAQRTLDVFATAEAQALLALFCAAADPLDDFAVAALLRSDWGRMGSAELDAWHGHAKGRSLFETLLERGGGPPCIRALADLVERGSTDATRCFRTMSEAAGALPPTDALLRVLETASQASDVRSAVMALGRWQAEGAMIHERPEGPGIRLLTVHGSKGLEFDYVVLADLFRTAPRLQPPIAVDEGRMGLRYRDEGGNPVEEAEYEALKERDWLLGQAESKRLLYVALTRAREKLVLVKPAGTVRIPKDSWVAWLEPLSGL